MSSKTPKEKKPGLSDLLAFAGKRKWLTYLGCLLSALSMLLGFGPYICLWFVARDLLAVAPNWAAATEIATYGWWAFSFALASILLYLVALLCTHMAAFRTASNIKKQTTEHLTKVPLGYFDSRASGELRRIIDGCATNTETLMAHLLPDSAGSAALAIGLLVVLFVFDWRMGLACLLAMVISLACIMTMMSAKGAKFMAQYQEAQVRMTKTGTEYVRGVPVVKVFQQTVHTFRAFYDAINDYSRLAEDYAVKFCQKKQVTNLTVVNGLAIFLVPLVLFLAPGETNLATFLANFAFYCIFSALISTAMTRVMFIGQESQISADVMQRVGEIMNAPVISTPSKAEVKTPADNSIEFEDVSFAYEGTHKNALDHLSFTVPAGATVALVGPSGGGKTTAACLVPRFWDAGEGSIKIGGTDVKSINPTDLMNHVAFVFQNSRLFKQSILDNVIAGKTGATREDALAALEAAQCNDIIEKLPKGIDALIGSEGTYLSGGEQQRIMIARAILKDAPIVVLDEATAFADPENETLIQKAFGSLCENKTVLMIAHRLSTVVNADKIIVLNEGKVAEEGIHADLLADQGLYARLWNDYQKSTQWKIAKEVA